VPDMAWSEPRRANLYQFTGSNPNRYMDPDGRDWGWLERAFDAIAPNSRKNPMMLQQDLAVTFWSPLLSLGGCGDANKAAGDLADVINGNGGASHDRKKRNQLIALGGSMVGNLPVGSDGRESTAWGTDDKGSMAGSIVYHYGVHGAEVGANSAAEYVSMAAKAAKDKGKRLDPVPGRTANTTRYLANGGKNYIETAIVIDHEKNTETEIIISYGKKNKNEFHSPPSKDFGGLTDDIISMPRTCPGI
jgi:hypothetical protein